MGARCSKRYAPPVVRTGNFQYFLKRPFTKEKGAVFLFFVPPPGRSRLSGAPFAQILAVAFCVNLYYAKNKPPDLPPPQIRPRMAASYGGLVWRPVGTAREPAATIAKERSSLVICTLIINPIFIYKRVFYLN